MKKKYPTGTKINRWRLWYEPWKKADGTSVKRAAVRRRVVLPDGKVLIERLKATHYSKVRENEEELKSLVRRLNAEQFKEELSIEKILDRNAFLNPKLIERYNIHLEVHSPSDEKIQREMSLLKNYVLNAFVGKFGLIDPKDWYRERDRWYGYLLEDAPKSSYTKQYIVQVLNKFMRWIHEERETEMPLYVFKGISAKKLQNIERERLVDGDKKVRRSIPDSDWKKIKLALPADIRPFIFLSYHYGLGRSESLGLLFEGTDCVYKEHLELKRQLKSYDSNTGEMVFEKLKSPGRTNIHDQSERQEQRLIPHWLDVDPQKTCDWIEEGQEFPMHPDTLTKKWRELMKRLEMEYDIHELRHSWITRARAKYDSRLVQLAAGHASIATTERYSHDHRSMSGERVRPKKAS